MVLGKLSSSLQVKFCGLDLDLGSIKFLEEVRGQEQLRKVEKYVYEYEI